MKLIKNDKIKKLQYKSNEKLMQIRKKLKI